MATLTVEKPIALPSPMTAHVRSGENAGRAVLLTRYHPHIGKWEYDWPHSAAIGFMTSKELLPPAGHRFSNGTIVPVKDRSQIQGGDPFAAIPDGECRTPRAILIQLTSGRILPAYPTRTEQGELWLHSVDPFIHLGDFAGDDYRVEEGKVLLHPDLVTAWQSWLPALSTS
jgi:hypothetical protein